MKCENGKSFCHFNQVFEWSFDGFDKMCNRLSRLGSGKMFYESVRQVS